MSRPRPTITGILPAPSGDLVFTLIPVKEIPPRIKEITFELITIRPAQEFIALGARLEWELSYMAIHGLDTERDLMKHLSEEKMSFYDMLEESP